LKIRGSHQWRKYQGMFVLTVISIHWGYETCGLTLLNFTIELDL